MVSVENSFGSRSAPLVCVASPTRRCRWPSAAGPPRERRDESNKFFSPQGGPRGVFFGVLRSSFGRSRLGRGGFAVEVLAPQTPGPGSLEGRSTHRIGRSLNVTASSEVEICGVRWASSFYCRRDLPVARRTMTTVRRVY